MYLLDTNAAWIVFNNLYDFFLLKVALKALQFTLRAFFTIPPYLQSNLTVASLL